MAFKYKIAVLGPIPRDHITTFRGEIIKKYGGINHATIALARLLDKKSTIIPVAHVRKKDEQPIKKILKNYTNVDVHHIDSKVDQGDVIKLRFIDKNKRLEKQTGFMNPINPEDVENLMDCDAFIILPVTDFEISLETLKFIKTHSKGLVIFDAHGPTTIVTSSGDRLMKFWIDRDNWLSYIDILKLNLDEAKCSWFHKEYKPEKLEKGYQFDLANVPPFAQHCLDIGVKAVYLTLDERGCISYFKKNKQIKEQSTPAIKVENIVDTTGCGDAFAAGLAFGILTTGDYIKAAQYGNAVGAQRTQGKDFSVFKTFAETKQMIDKAYGEN
ncbi:MAG: carbohydrate kinase [Coxiella sp. DG_40]|nr:MAG: carbohydrate kinase [Coxiella sp. DG_40]